MQGQDAVHANLGSGDVMLIVHQIGTEVVEIGTGKYRFVYSYPYSKAARSGMRTA